MAKLSTFMISLVLVSMAIGIFSIFLTQMKSGYGEQEGMSEQDLALLDKMSNVTSKTQDIQNEVTTFSEKDNPFDVIGNFFSSAWGSVKLAGSSLDLVVGKDGMVETVSDKTNLGEAGAIIKAGLIAILVILVTVGILVSVLIKRDL